jgi:hypothetical protein
MKKRLINQLLAISIFLFLGCKMSETEKPRWTIEQANEWAKTTGWLVGSNFVPSTTVNQIEMWQKETFDTATIDRELGYAESIGFNAMRIFLNHKVWMIDTAAYINRMDQFLSIASKHKIKTIFVIFDDCFNGTSSVGKQPDPIIGIHNSRWVQDPGQKESYDTTGFPILKKYVKDIMNHFADDKRVVMWDLYNEPGNTNKGDSSLNLLKHVFSWARSTKATQPFTSGVWCQHFAENINKFQLENSDIITFHNYEPEASMKAAIDSLRKYNRPVMCTEFMARPRGSRFDNILPLLKKENIGGIVASLVSGRLNCMYAWGDTTHKDGSEPKVWFHDVFRKDGTPYSQAEVDLIRKLCLDKSK